MRNMSLEYEIEFVMVTDWPGHWELPKKRGIEGRIFEPHETCYAKSVINDISIDKIIKNQRNVGTLFIKVKSKKDREVENAWEGFTNNFRKEPSIFNDGDQVTFNVHITKRLKDIIDNSIKISPKYNRYLKENGLYKVIEQDIEKMWE